MSDYREVLQNPKTAFKSYDLQNAIVKQTPLRLPSLVSGGFALTACLTTQTNGTRSTWAIRCFHKQVTDLQERYSYISNFLQDKTSNFFVNFQYEQEGIQVQGKWYPIVKMPWVEGVCLSEYIQDNLNNPTRLNDLANQVKLVSNQLHKLKMAHGDIQHGNILVRDNGNCVLIDYDGMYVPGMPYKNSNETGHVAFQHPGRNSSFFNEKVDRFSTIIFYVSLLSLASSSGRDVWKQYHTGENLIFSRKDYQDPESSDVFSHLLNNSELSPLVRRLQQLCRCHIEDIPTLDDFLNPHISLASLKTAIPSSITSRAIDEIAAFDAKQTLKLVKQEGEKITVIGQVVNTFFPGNGDLFFINFGNLRDTINNYNPFTVVIFSRGLRNLQQVKNLNKADLEDFKNKHLEITGILELYPNKKGYITPRIVLEDPYQLKVLTQGEAANVLDASTTNTSQAVKPVVPTVKSPQNIPVPAPPANSVSQPPPSSPFPLKPVPPPPNQAYKVRTTSQTQHSSPTVPPPASAATKQTTSSTTAQAASTSQKTQPAPSNSSPVPNTASSESDSSCFIATAAYESKDHPDVETFRTFRDRVLLRYTVGKYLVNIYYWIGPYLAKLVSSHLPVKKLVRSSLEQLAQWIRVKNI